jgi:hypothetical protein
MRAKIRVKICTYEEDKCTCTDGPPRCERLESRCKGKVTPVEALCVEPFGEPKIRDPDTEPGDQTTDSGEVGEPGKDDARAAAEGHICEKGEAGTEPHGNIW